MSLLVEQLSKALLALRNSTNSTPIPRNEEFLTRSLVYGVCHALVGKVPTIKTIQSEYENIYQILIKIKDSTDGEYTKYSLKSKISWPVSYDEVMGHLLLISDSSKDKIFTQNEANFNLLIPRLKHTMYDLDNHLEVIEDHFLGSSLNTVYTKEINMPFWFVSQIQNNLRGNFYENFESAIEAVEALKFEDPITLEQLMPRLRLGYDLDNKIKHMSKLRKLAGNKEQLNNLLIGKKNFQSNKSQNNESSDDNGRQQIYEDLIAHTENAISRLESEINVIIPAMISPSMLESDTYDTSMIPDLGDEEYIDINNIEDFENVCPAMDADVEPTIDVQVNTAIANSGQEDLGQIVQQEINYSPREFITDQQHSYPDLTSRWALFSTIDLNNTITKGTVLAVYHMPYHFLQANWDNPITTPFKIFDFYRGGMKLKVQMNIPKTNQFALQVGVVPHLLEHDRYDELLNIHTVSQQAGGRMNGHKETSLAIDIPIQSYLNVIPIRVNSNALNLYTYSFSVIALTDYEISTGGIDSSKILLYANFENDLEFSGMRPQDNIFPENVLIPNPDAVREIIIPSMMVGAASAVKYGAMIGVAKVVSGEINSQGKGALDGVKSSIGLGNRQKARSNNSNAERQHNKTNVRRSNDDKANDLSNKTIHQSTSIDLASGCGSYSGSNYRLQEAGCVTSVDQFNSVERINTLKDIMSIKSFITSFKISSVDPPGTPLFGMKAQPSLNQPFLYGSQFGNDMGNWAAVDQITGWFENYQGKIRLHFTAVADGFKTFRLRVAFVPNSLTLTYDESASVYFSTYDVGPDLNTGLDFEFEVPFIHASPNYKLRDNQGNSYVSGSIHVFVEQAIQQPENGYQSCDILVYKNINPNEYGVGIPGNNVSRLIADPILESAFVSFTLVGNTFSSYVNGSLQTSTLLTVGGSIFLNTLNATFITDSVNEFNWNYNPLEGSLALRLAIHREDSSTSINVLWNNGTSWADIIPPSTVVNKQWYFSGPSLGLVVGLRTPKDAIKSKSKLVFEDFDDEVITPSMDPRFSDDQLLKVTPAVEEKVAALLGEEHSDLDDNMRRFAHIMSFPSVNVSEMSSPTRVLSLPANFGAPLFRDQLPYNIRRDKLVHIHDAFRFTRGSLRYVVNINSLRQLPFNSGTFTVIHKPQVDNLPFNFADQITQMPYENIGYGESLFILNQNGSHTFEIPMYTPNACLVNSSYLSDYNLIKYSQALGTIDFMYTGPACEYAVEIKRAWGDDVKMKSFIGFQQREPVYPSGEIPFYNVEDRIFPSMLNSFKETNVKLDTCLDAVTGLCDDIKVGTQHLVSTSANVSHMLETNVTKMENSVSDFLTRLTCSGDTMESVTTIILQSLQVYSNPKVSTICLSIAQILVSTKLFIFDNISKAVKYLTPIFSNLMGDGISPSMEVPNDNNALIEFSIYLTSWLCGCLAINKEARRSIVGVSKHVISNSFMQGIDVQTKVLKFLENVLKYLKKTMVFILEKFFPECSWLDSLKNGAFVRWLNYAAAFSDPMLIAKMKTDNSLVKALYTLIHKGDQYLINCENPLIRPKIMTYLSGMKAIRKDLVALGTSPVAKFDPFVFYIAGPSGIGKSYAAKKIINMINQRILKLPKVNIFTVPVDAFWEGYSLNPIIVFDDFGRTTPLDVQVSDQARLRCMKGPADAIIPKAFADKGTTSVARLILCLSNRAYPLINNMDDEVVCNGRDVVVRAAADFSNFTRCTKCLKFDIKCALCRSIKVNTDMLDELSHLRFKRLPVLATDQTQSEKRYPQVHTLETLLESLYPEMEAYYAAANKRYAADVREKLDLDPEDDISDFIIPQKPFEMVTQIFNDKELDECFDTFKKNVNLETYNNKSFRVNYADAAVRMADLKSKMRTVELAESSSLDPNVKPFNVAVQNFVFSDDCASTSKQGPPTIEINPSFIDIPRPSMRTLTFHELFSTDKKDCEHYAIYSTLGALPDLEFDKDQKPIWGKCDKKKCNWKNSIEALEFLKKFGDECCAKNVFPQNFPLYYIRHELMCYQELRNEQERILNTSKWQLITQYQNSIALALTAIGFAATATFLYRMAIKPARNPTMNIVNEGDIKPAARSEYDGGKGFKVKFLQRGTKVRKVTSNLIKKAPGVSMSPHQPATRFLNKFSSSKMDIVYKGKVWCSAVCVSPKIYWTQFHALSHLFHIVAEDLKATYEKFKKEGKDTNTHDTMISVHDLHKLIFVKIGVKGTAVKIEVPPYVFLQDMNKNIFYADKDDKVLFNFDHKNFNCTDLYSNIVSEGSKVDYNDCYIVRSRPQIDKRKPWNDITMASHVVELNANWSYETKDTPWCVDEKGEPIKLAVELSGFRCHNPFEENEYKVMCGSLLVDGKSEKVIGIMSASSSKCLYFNAISTQLLKEIGVDPVTEALIHTVDNEEAYEPILPACISEIGDVRALKPKIHMYHSVKTQIRPSICHELFCEAQRSPVEISTDGDKGQSSFKRAIVNYIPHKDIGERVLEMAASDLKLLYMTARTNLEYQSVRSMKEAVCGIEGIVKSINMNTSPGMPWIIKGGKKKDLVFYSEGVYDGIAPDLEKVLSLEMEMMKSGIVPFTISAISHKDELKEDPSKVRLIQGSPLSFTLHSRQYYMDALNAFTVDRNRLEHAVGIDVYSNEWHDLATSLLSYGNNICVGDFSKFGPRLNTKMLRHVNDIHNSWYTARGETEEEKHIRRMLGERILDSDNIAYGFIFKTLCGAPSGNIKTVFNNTTCNQLYFRCAWIEIMSKLKPDLANVMKFSEYVKFYCYGDDVIFSVKDEIKEIFNNETLSQYFESIDIKYTDTTKDGTIRKYCSLLESTFLKRGFKLFESGTVGDIWIATVTEEQAFDMMNWYRKQKNVSELENPTYKIKAVIDNAGNSLRAYWCFGREKYNNYQMKLISYISDYIGKHYPNQLFDMKPIMLSFEALQEEYGIPYYKKDLAKITEDPMLLGIGICD